MLQASDRMVFSVRTCTDASVRQRTDSRSHVYIPDDVSAYVMRTGADGLTSTLLKCCHLGDTTKAQH